ncbi:MAG: 1-acyl-sn-glycerol-3-phosphate acyltransferase [Lysobacter sp.]|nr:1-acyl-sn-glycerol-3-phosphate acyltransferase [Lysobacter sp.]
MRASPFAMERITMAAPQPPSADDADIVLRVPVQVPRAMTHAWERRFSRSILHTFGWSMRGELPDVPKAIVIGAPHSSNWDGIWVYFAATAMGIDIRILGKPVLFKIPVLNFILRRYGGMPADDNSGRNMLEHATALFRDADRFWFGIAPEGTRRQVLRWKIGFWKIAKQANVPIVLVYLHYPDKVIGVAGTFTPTDDMRGDIERIREMYRPWQGKHHGVE